MSDLLSGIRVLEVAVLFNGDRLGMLLGDMGADVVKVERPPVGDYLRDMLGQLSPRVSPAHAQVNKNKRSLSLDLHSAAGREVFLSLVDTADVVVDGLLPSAMDGLGLGPDALRARRPSLVYCRYTGFGTAGPYASVPTHGQMMDALAGAVPLRTEAGLVVRDETRGPWTTENGGEGTATGAAYAAMHVAAALVQSQRTGIGAFLDAAGADAVVTNAWTGVTYALSADDLADRRGMPAMEGGVNTSSRYQYYETRDGRYLLFCAIEDKFWRGFCAATGFAGPPERGSGPVDFGAGQDFERRALQAVFAERSLEEWMDLATTARLPIGPAHQAPADLLADVHLRARELFHPDVLPSGVPFTYLGQPVLVAGQPYAVRHHAPDVGQHTDEVLREAGFAAADVERLRAEGAI